MEKRYVISFVTSSIILIAIIFGFVTWMNPDRITPTPWSIDFVSDRNMSLKKFSLLKDNSSYSELIVGSSTSEVLVPEMLEKLYGVKSYLGGTGGSKTPYKYAQISYALENNPNLKRIIYVVDFFEFTNTEVDTKVYYQAEIMNQVEPELRSLISSPDWISRVQDYFSEPTIKSASKTLSDYKKLKKGTYQSQFRPDGTTARSMVEYDHQEAIEPRVTRIARAYEGIYKNLEDLDPATTEFLKKITEKAKAKNVKIAFILAPWHSLFYKHFEADLHKKGDLYQRWIQTIQDLQSDDVQVVDFSYPKSLEKGIGDEKEFWHDGVHFSHKSAEIILNEIYKNSQAKQ